MRKRLELIFFDMHCIKEDKDTDKPVTVLVKVNGVPITVEVDSGAGKSVMPFSVYKKFLDFLELKSTPIRLKMYNGFELKPEGEIKVTVSHNSHVCDGTFIIVKKGVIPLLGRDLMNKLGFIVKNVNNIEAQDISFDKLLEKYSELFNDELGCYKDSKVELKVMQDAKPVFLKPRPIPFALKEKVSEELDNLEKKGIITKVNNSEWGTPLVPVVKPNGDIRICGDYKVTINKFIEDVKEPLPRIEEVFSDLCGGENFSKLDLAWAYNQLEVNEETKKLLAWSTHKGIYLVNRLTFGPKPAVAVFVKEMKKVLQGAQGVTFFVDDIIVTGKNKVEHLKNLEEVFERLKKAGFKLNKLKCKFFQPEIKFLGHKINKFGLLKDESKTEAILKVPRPRNFTELKSFLGMINYYSKFIPMMADILAPLYSLLKDKQFQWTKNCDEIFERIKNEIVSERCLVHFDQRLPLKLVCDASNIGIGSVLLHVFPDGKERPISFASRILQPAEKKYAVIQKEALAIYWSVCKFYQYLMGNKFVLGSDHKPLLALFGENKGIPTMAAGRLQRWALFLSGFDYKFEYIRGKSNGAADGLSRFPLEVKIDSTESEDFLNFICGEKIPISADEIKKATRIDQELSKVFLYTREGWPAVISDILKPYAIRKNEITIEREILYWGYRVIIPIIFRQELLAELHGAHMGMAKMKAVARQYFWWPKMDFQIEFLVNNCEACKTYSKKPEKSKLKKFEEPSRVFERVHVDFLGPFKGKTYFVLIDAYSRWPEIYEMSKTDSSSTIEVFREIFSRFGLPELVISDNGSQLVSEEMEHFFEINGIKHRTSAPYHPETNGLAENMVGNFKSSMNKALFDKNNEKSSVKTLINRFLASYRNSPHSVTGETPAKRMFNRELRTRLSFLSNDKAEKIRENQTKYFHGSRVINFEEGGSIYMRDYRDPNKPTWCKGSIKTKLGSKTYLCEPEYKKDFITKRHSDQILKNRTFYENDYQRIKYDLDGENTVPLEDKQDPLVFGENQDKACDNKSDLIQLQNSKNQEVSVEKVKVEKSQRNNFKHQKDFNLNVNSRPKREIRPVVKMNI